MQATYCACGALVDRVRHVRCQSCKTRFDESTPVQATGTSVPNPTGVRLFSMDGRRLDGVPVTGSFLALLPGGSARKCQTVNVDALHIVTSAHYHPGTPEYPVFLYEYLT